MDNNNIHFFLEEKNEELEDTEIVVPPLWSKLENEDDEKLEYYFDKEFYGNDELYYTQEYTIKDLLKICQYYGIDKYIKSAKCKKYDIISSIVYFESLPENFELVQKRNRMWAYMMELTNDPKMKKYVIWN